MKDLPYAMYYSRHLGSVNVIAKVPAYKEPQTL